MKTGKKIMKKYKWNTQELCDSIKRPHLQIMGFEEQEEVQGKGVRKVFNKITAKKFSILRKRCSPGTEGL
jgi:hypothetical protein